MEYLNKIKFFLKSNKLTEAKTITLEALQKYPNHLNLLIIATDVYRAIGNREKSLEYAELLITHYPENWLGYARASQDLISIKRFEEAQIKVNEGLKRIPNHLNLLTIATDVYRAIGNREKSLEYSELLITHYPENWLGYARASQDKLSLGQFNTSEYKLKLESCQPPTDKKMLKLLNNIYSGDNSIKKDLWIHSYKSVNQKIVNNGNVISASWQPFQYWSQGDPPDQIKIITSLWNEIFSCIGIAPIKLFDKTKALQYIEQNCPELITSFKTAFHYAVEADIFRIAYAQKKNCIWLDSDLYPKINTKNSLKLLLAEKKVTLLFRWMQPAITNAFFIAPSSSLFFKNLINSVKDTDFNSLPKTTKTIFTTFGPWQYGEVLNKFIEANLPTSKLLLEDENWNIKNFNFVNDHNFVNMGPPFKLDYKMTKASWQNYVNG